MFTELAQKNLDHFNNHPTQHNLAMVAAGVAWIVVVSKVAKRLAKDNTTLRAGQNA